MRVLVDVDVSQPLPDKILEKMIDKDSQTYVIFFVPISYERLPRLCTNCEAFLHSTSECKKRLVPGSDAPKEMYFRRRQINIPRNTQGQHLYKPGIVRETRRKI